MQTGPTLLPVTSSSTSSSSGNSSPTGCNSKAALSANRMFERNTPGMFNTCTKLIRSQGFTALYAGLTACWLKQLTYSTARFAFYEILKEKWPAESRATLLSRMVCSAGTCANLTTVIKSYLSSSINKITFSNLVWASCWSRGWTDWSTGRHGQYSYAKWYQVACRTAKKVSFGALKLCFLPMLSF